jgi:hypothetical protein
MQELAQGGAKADHGLADLKSAVMSSFRDS